MEKNVGKTDRIIRFVLAAALGGIYLAGAVEGTVGIIVLVGAAILLISALTSFCLCYKIFSMIPCCKSESSDPHKSGGCCGHCGSEDSEDKK